MMTRIYGVVGMSCANCVRHVTEAVSAVPGIESVDVILDTGRLTVTAKSVDDAAVAAAVDEAGYSLTM